MSRRLLIGTFQAEHDVLSATAAVRSRGYTIVDVLSPLPVHGIDEAMGLPPSRLTWVCFGGGLAGLVLATWFQVWTSAVDWPLNVGGKPLFSLPAFVPVAFEVTILFAGLAAFFALWVRSGLYPGRSHRTLIPRVTDDRFALVVLEHDASFSPLHVKELLLAHGALEVSEREEDTR